MCNIDWKPGTDSPAEGTTDASWRSWLESQGLWLRDDLDGKGYVKLGEETGVNIIITSFKVFSTLCCFLRSHYF